MSYACIFLFTFLTYTISYNNGAIRCLYLGQLNVILEDGLIELFSCYVFSDASPRRSLIFNTSLTFIYAVHVQLTKKQ